MAITPSDHHRLGSGSTASGVFFSATLFVVTVCLISALQSERMLRFTRRYGTCVPFVNNLTRRAEKVTTRPAGQRGTGPTADSIEATNSGTASRPMRADAVKNRQRILEAAETTFASLGLSVPIDTVAERAGVGVGTLYRHFPTKEALFEAIVMTRLEELLQEIRIRAD